MDNVREQIVEGVLVTTELESEDTLAVLVKRIRLEARVRSATRAALEKQARAIVDQITYLDGELRVIEVDGIANAVQIRSKPAAPGAAYAEIILREGWIITVEGRGSSIHLSKDNYQRLIQTLARLL